MALKINIDRIIFIESITYSTNRCLTTKCKQVKIDNDIYNNIKSYDIIKYIKQFELYDIDHMKYFHAPFCCIFHNCI